MTLLNYWLDKSALKADWNELAEDRSLQGCEPIPEQGAAVTSRSTMSPEHRWLAGYAWWLWKVCWLAPGRSFWCSVKCSYIGTCPIKGAFCHLPQVVHIHVFYPTNQYPTPQFCNTMQFLNIACNDIIPDKIPDLANFRQFFFCHKGGQMLFDLNFDAIFGILSSFSIY